MKLTIKEIAKLSGVSQSTVSKIINNYDDVGEKTKAKVNAVMEEHGYRPTYSAQTLARKSTKMIGVIYAGDINANFDHPFFSEVVSSFKKTIGAQGYDLLFFSNEKFHKADEDYLARCQHYHVDGCIIIGGEKVEPSVYALDQSEIPCVGIDIELQGPRSAYIMTDNHQVSGLAVEHFYLLGWHDVAFIGGQQESLVSSQREEGFKDHIATYGMKTKTEWLIYGDFFEQSGYDGMKQLLLLEERPHAIFAASDLMALGAMKAIKDHGADIGEFGIIGCDDITAAKYVDPPLTTVRQDKEKIGKMAAFILQDLMHDRIKGTAVKIDPDLIVRKSCGSKRESSRYKENAK
ncbi:LacI family DNA-binding transcriptional regulator [Salisediminibacterium halotolerans]|uniref:LacI family DNA-binding transcriptional regulator n=1 Tax=Salisediminibacterium halotolerans TaxID=517425 RepID=UPI000EAB850F|nr:LacI family DNA-binding transcriptional regulator [Salisediminibacterium halotolerans]RLJ78294.1 LacI family transcriptional regulator [Actinophytocola xinjiangensis]RPE88367.1 LacI family transcriptional regulator [Salisediminibacterium halotolerans]TWG37270.1 LacI family transcriptional regulator [Salisediminibacterium halotolerans]GEL08321.1 LacI family transcriptional regulator [Salisediminibacterium halotolerans]